MVKVRFLYDGRPKGWRYRENEEALLPDNLAHLAIMENLAVPISGRMQMQTDPRTTRSLDEARERRSLK